MNRRTGLDVRTWLEEGLVDYVVPLSYAYFVLDSQMPIDWLVRAAHAHEVSVYAMLQPYYTEENRRFYTVSNATPAMMRAAAANFQAKEVDGLYTWFMAWPLGEAERNTLTELGRRGLIEEGDKHYFLCRKPESEHVLGYEALLPIQIDRDDLGKSLLNPLLRGRRSPKSPGPEHSAQAQYLRPGRGGSPRGGAERPISRRGSVPGRSSARQVESVHRAMAGIPPRKGAGQNEETTCWN